MQIRFIFQKYVPNDVINTVLEKASSSLLIGNKQNVTILFSDIRGFTNLSEQLDPEELVNSLNVYFNVMVEQIFRYGGIVDKFIGDAIMALFGAPKESVHAPEQAVKAAIYMHQALALFNVNQRKIKRAEFSIGIGINTGSAIVGNIGSEQKLDYTVIGDSVNLGARLEGLTKYYQVPILISEYTRAAIANSEDLIFLNIDVVRVKGRNVPVKIYEPMFLRTLGKVKHFIEQFHTAQQMYFNGEFENALNSFKEIQVPSKYLNLNMLYIKRCEHLIKNPPKHWDGVETWEIK